MSDRKAPTGNVDKLREQYEEAKANVSPTLPGTPEHQEARNAKAEAFNALTEAERTERRDRDKEIREAKLKAQEARQKAADALADSDPNGPPTQTEPNFGLGTAPRTPSPANAAFERAGLRDVENADIKKAEGFSRHGKEHGKGESGGAAAEVKQQAGPTPTQPRVQSAAK